MRQTGVGPAWRKAHRYATPYMEYGTLYSPFHGWSAPLPPPNWDMAMYYARDLFGVGTADPRDPSALVSHAYNELGKSSCKPGAFALQHVADVAAAGRLAHHAIRRRDRFVTRLEYTRFDPTMCYMVYHIGVESGTQFATLWRAEMRAAQQNPELEFGLKESVGQALGHLLHDVMLVPWGKSWVRLLTAEDLALVIAYGDKADRDLAFLDCLALVRTP